VVAAPSHPAFPLSAASTTRSIFQRGHKTRTPGRRASGSQAWRRAGAVRFRRRSWKLPELIFGCVLCALALSAYAYAGEAEGQAPNTYPLNTQSADINDQIYYKNKISLAIDAAYLPFNMPLLFDPLEGKNWAFQPGTVPYTLVPLTASLRWQPFKFHGNGIFRGTPDFSFGGLYTAITRGPESYYAAAVIGARYNFVQPNWRWVPYFEIRGGAGMTDAKQPEEVAHHEEPAGQGQDFTFTFLMAGGIQYNLSPRYSFSAALAYMHISNFYLSEPQYKNLGINVYGPMIGMAVALTPMPSLHRAFRTFVHNLEGPGADTPN
jgi:hypothetical protein